MVSGISQTLVVFGGHRTDIPLATDFVTIAKKLIANGLDPTCISGTDLRDVMELVNFPLVFGREDIGCTQVYDKVEATTPFYPMVSPEGLKHDVLIWIANVARSLVPNSRIVLIFVGHRLQGGRFETDYTWAE